MGNRPGRIPANPGRASIDLGAIVGAAGGMGLEGGATEGAMGATDAASMLSPEMGSAMSSTIAANTPATMLNPYATNSVATSANFTPYKASWFQNLLSKGGAGMQANQLNNQVLMQQMANQGNMGVQGMNNINQMDIAKLGNQNNLDVAALNGTNQLATTQAMGKNAMDLATENGYIAAAAKLGVHPDLIRNVVSELNQQQLNIAKQSGANNLGLAQLTGKVQATPEFGDTFAARLNAENMSPVAKNMNMAQVLNPDQVSFGYGSKLNPLFGMGNTGGSSVVSTENSYNPTTFAQKQSVTTTKNGGTMGRQFQLGPNGKMKLDMPSPDSLANGLPETKSVSNPFPSKEAGPSNFSISGNKPKEEAPKKKKKELSPVAEVQGPPAPYSLGSNSQGLNNLVNSVVNGYGDTGTNSYGSNSPLLNNLLRYLGANK